MVRGVGKAQAQAKAQAKAASQTQAKSQFDARLKAVKLMCPVSEVYLDIHLSASRTIQVADKKFLYTMM
jgi:hypothetical protein